MAAVLLEKEAGGDGCFFFFSFLCCWSVFGGGVEVPDASSDFDSDEGEGGRVAWPGVGNRLCNVLWFSSEEEFLLPSVVESWEAMGAEEKGKGSSVTANR